MELFDQITNKLVHEAYNNLDNYKIIEGDTNSDIIYIYFTSNGLYYPNTEENFKETIESDKYEWKGNLVKDARKHILLRDVYKQWYVKGINSRINTIENVVDFLLNETRGYKTITLGSSSGGYMAMLVGRKLKSLKIYSFNGQFNIEDQLIGLNNRNKNPLLVKLENNSSFSNYYNIVPYLKNGTAPIFYFSSTHSQWDTEQGEIAKDINDLYPLFIKSDIHGIAFYKQNLIKVLSASKKELVSWSRYKAYSQFSFSLKVVGLIKTLKILKQNR
ncbi:hypothetical protein [Gelidibacter salicanalis]|uniref:Alpha/beta hydrolase n=1 Tax=Gelidibacter salicanalis TaxID=291193 RepID=A0A934KHQ7_9FLAO|nr:hypothetical protein [Gelidibacter salicanalis]MBJ7879172.1 hypothetical protein [Gelidibacter salicanalis]